MNIRRFGKWDCPQSEITPYAVYQRRRDFMRGLLGVGLASLAPGQLAGAELVRPGEALPAAPGPFSTDETRTPYEDVTRYNNFYEFGPDKGDPARYAGQMQVRPWHVEVTGLCGRPGQYPLETILKPHSLEERIYRLRCVEAWSMVIPWIGFPLADLLKRFEPASSARYVMFQTLYRPEEMPGTRSGFSRIDWPYQEGLRLDEALHPLTFMAVGLYGRTLPNQNGAPLRLVVPWKYGFKSIKSIVRIHFQESQPATTWNDLAPDEYGFYANVNPNVDHPRWSQARERRLPSGFFSPNWRETRLFNGYQEQVAGLYSGMDLKRYY